ncbi:Oidioi.mRNA.OKI2018_I69.chr1.g1288.t1.cds [Oikopleura dioica]|uniref:Phosphoglycerate mutase n=1 Tax=Oikopleura dioica TaxID=34765 RepID=A0ABN7SMG7_OIKDI|nr:Oidioi.mRNA.OKI2018_I69.chr1.g1288.t1.cds [Oikopleura dioica]
MTEKPLRIVMVRHGESQWNHGKLFCGWYNCPLTKTGENEARQAGKALKEKGIEVDAAFSSLLLRANQTCDLILEELGVKEDVEVKRSWRLNERHYGDLTGQNKVVAVAKYGADQVKLWRRSYDVAPPPISQSNPYYTQIQQNKVFVDVPKEEFPTSESLKMTTDRSWPAIKSGKTVLLAAHGNLLRGLIKNIDNVSEEDIINLNLPTGIPFIYEFDKDMKPTKSLEFISDEKIVKTGLEKVKDQTTKTYVR